MAGASTFNSCYRFFDFFDLAGLFLVTFLAVFFGLFFFEGAFVFLALVLRFFATGVLGRGGRFDAGRGAAVAALGG